MGALFGVTLIAALALIAWKNWDWGHTLFAPMCHQKSERCLAIGGTAMAVCARCVGIYAGLAFGCGVYWARGFRVRRAGSVLGGALVLNAGDFLLEWSGGYESFLWIRLGLGLILGVAIPVFVFSRLRDR